MNRKEMLERLCSEAMAEVLVPGLDDLLRDLAERQVCRERASAAVRRPSPAAKTKTGFVPSARLSDDIGSFLARYRQGSSKQPVKTIILGDEDRKTIDDVSPAVTT